MARLHLLCLLLACTPAHSDSGERDAGAIETSRQPVRNAAPVSEECRDPDNIRIDGMARWACGLAIASKTSGTTGSDPENRQ